MELAEAAEEGAVGDDAAETGAGGGGAGERGWRGQANEDLLQDLVGEVPRRLGHGGRAADRRPPGWRGERKSRGYKSSVGLERARWKEVGLGKALLRCPGRVLSRVSGESISRVLI